MRVCLSMVTPTLNSAHNEVAFNEKSAITKENLRNFFFRYRQSWM